jgi:Rrf2 family iron-sulfur cluster assembly transcriptional regulator
MRLTRSVSYAVGILVQIHQLAGEGQITAARISRGCRFPPRFLYRILRRLVDAGLLRGTSGPGGGYALAKSPKSITLLDIVSGVESAPAPSVLEPVCAKHRKAIDQINRVCARSTRQFATELDRISLLDLVESKKSQPRGPQRVARRRAGAAKSRPTRRALTL